MVNINLIADVQYEQDAEINIVNLHEIASLIDKKTIQGILQSLGGNSR